MSRARQRPDKNNRYTDGHAGKLARRCSADRQQPFGVLTLVVVYRELRVEASLVLRGLFRWRDRSRSVFPFVLRPCSSPPAAAAVAAAAAPSSRRPAARP